jgi:hypothetical protein
MYTKTENNFLLKYALRNAIIIIKYLKYKAKNRHKGNRIKVLCFISLSLDHWYVYFVWAKILVR